MNEVQEGVVDSQNEQTTEVVEEQAGVVESVEETQIEEVTTSQQEEAKQSKEDNSKFAKARREAEEEKKVLESKLAKMQKLTGMDFDQTLAYLEEQELANKAQQFAQENSVSEEFAKKQLSQDSELQQLRNQMAEINATSKYETEKATIKDKPFFSELEAEIKDLVTSEAKRGKELNAHTAYKYLLGENYEKLIANTQQSTIANVQDKIKRGLPVSDSDSTSGASDVTINRHMAAVFGNDPTEIQSYVRKFKK